jgi:multisubunit Na+/H+ antiporter MnhB subunit
MRGMSPIVQCISRLMAPSIFLLGVYVVLHGHLTPGGGFAGGVLIAGAFVLLVLAFGADEWKSRVLNWNATVFESLGLFIFWFVAMLGLIEGVQFFVNVIAKANPGLPYRLFSAGIVPLCNVAIGIEVAAGLFFVFMCLAILKMGEKP